MVNKPFVTHLLIHQLGRFVDAPLDAPSPSTFLLVRRVVEFIHLRLSRAVKITEIAVWVGVSPWHLNRVFKRVTGRSLHQYLVEMRIHTALQLMKEGRLPLKQIALQVGFVDQSHFTRHFKRTLGITPTEYLKRTNILNLSTILQDKHS